MGTKNRAEENRRKQLEIPPDVPKIHNEAGVVLPSHAGPYEEGGDLLLICVVTGAIPANTFTAEADQRRFDVHDRKHSFTEPHPPKGSPITARPGKAEEWLPSYSWFTIPQHAFLPVRAGLPTIQAHHCANGNPTPKITWSSNGKTLPSAMIDYAHESTLSSRLVVRNLSRAHQHNVYSCQASNFYRRNVTANVTIELRLRPLAVEIVNGSSPLSADRRYIVQCQSVGSRPPAKITWWMGGVQLTSTNQTTSEDGNSTLASLSFTPTREDHGKTLICRATNELVKRGTKETSMKLNVFCK
uniref:Ig-like domain-containing protein n=1 Tax=Anopheles melas TaxID=34690 RepID=A0A182TEH9_9DIPT